MKYEPLIVEMAGSDRVHPLIRGSLDRGHDTFKCGTGTKRLNVARHGYDFRRIRHGSGLSTDHDTVLEAGIPNTILIPKKYYFLILYYSIILEMCRHGHDMAQYD